MAVRNGRDIGVNLQKIMTRLMANDKLVNLLYYTSANPLGEANLTTAQKNSEIFNKLIKVVPKVDANNASQSIVSIRVAGGRKTTNDEFRTVTLLIDVIVPFSAWVIKDTNLRPFAILGEIQDSLENKKIDGLGKMVGGDFDLNYLTDEVGCYTAEYRWVNYD